MDKYKRPPNDPLYQARSWVEWRIEMYEDLMSRRDELKEGIKDGTLDQGKADSLIRAIEAVLEEKAPQSDDPLIDKWEAELEAGLVPNLDEK